MTDQLGLFDEGAPTSATPEVGALGVDPGMDAVAARLPAALRLGTSSWSFPGWAGIVYDRAASERDLAREGLAAYARHPLLRTVGLDRTYYRSVDSAVYARYAEQVPDDFRFLVKADRLVTSPHHPEDGTQRGPNPNFLDPTFAFNQIVEPVVEGLGDKAGPILFQFSPIPPNLVGGPRAFLHRLHEFLASLPQGPLYAVELRTPEFLTVDYGAILEETRVAHCYVVHPSMPSIPAQRSVLSAVDHPALVVRWMLHSGMKYDAARDRYAPFDRLVDEDPASRAAIVQAVFDTLIMERPAFVVVNNKAEGSSPLSVMRLAEAIAGDAAENEGGGRPPERATPEPPDQR